MNMTISASGVLIRAAERLENTRDAKYLAYPIRELYGHLKEFKNRIDAGEDANVIAKEFFGTWSGFEAKA